MARDGETARFAGISDLAAEKVIVQETGREAGGSARKVVCNALKMQKLRELEVSRQGKTSDKASELDFVSDTLIVKIGRKMQSRGQGGEVYQEK